jgi:hypothetical protein
VEVLRKTGFLPLRRRSESLTAEPLEQRDYTMSEDIPFIFRQISRCLHLAELCADGEISDMLLGLARQFAHRAIQLGADQGSVPEIPDRAPYKNCQPEARRWQRRVRFAHPAD